MLSRHPSPDGCTSLHSRDLRDHPPRTWNVSYAGGTLVDSDQVPNPLLVRTRVQLLIGLQPKSQLIFVVTFRERDETQGI